MKWAHRVGLLSLWNQPRSQSMLARPVGWRCCHSTDIGRLLGGLGLAAALLCLTSSSFAATLHIKPDGTGDFPTVRAGVASAANGDTILVEFGTYYEDSILVDKSIVITGPPTPWPSIRGRLVMGAWIGVIFKVLPGASPIFQNLILRDADVGILARNDTSNCGLPGANMEADNVVLLNLREAGIDNDNLSCTTGTATITNCTAINCGIGFQINDYGTVTASKLVALACTYGVKGLDYKSATFRYLDLWLNTFDADGIAVLDTVVANPLLCDIFHDRFGVGPTSPCLAANNSWAVLMGVEGQACDAVVGVEDESAYGLPAVRVAGRNPTEMSTRLTYLVPHASRVRMAIFNVRGQLVRSLLDEVVGSGLHTVEWDGKDRHGLRVTSGLYFARVDEEKWSSRCRIAVLR